MTHPLTPEEQAAERARQKAQAIGGVAPKTDDDGNHGQNLGIFDLIVGFIKFFFDNFLKGAGAPNEEGPQGDAADSGERLSALGKSLVANRALPLWKTYQQTHAGEGVTHISPVAGRAEVTSGFGYRDKPMAGASTDHKGVDIGARGGDTHPDILASAGGIVLFSGRKSGYGNAVIIGHANGEYTLYGHLTGEKMPAAGQEVVQGAVIGVMGNEGISTGPHLHYEQHLGDRVFAPRIRNVTVAKGMALDGSVSLAHASPQPAAAKSALHPHLAALATPQAGKLPHVDVAEIGHQTLQFGRGAITRIGALISGKV